MRAKSSSTRQLRRKQIIELFSKIPACLVGMEACGTAHHPDVGIVVSDINMEAEDRKSTIIVSASVFSGIWMSH